MTEQLKAALDQLNACQTADDVAALLRRHGVRASSPHGAGKARCATCPLAVYLQVIGGTIGSTVNGWGEAELPCGDVDLNKACRDFILAADDGKYPDLEAAA